jgi:hypothetical protein
MRRGPLWVWPTAVPIRAPAGAEPPVIATNHIAKTLMQ